MQNGGQRIDCVVVDISEGGVRIRCGDAGAIEAQFDLEIQSDDFVVKCERVHIQSDSLGARFIQSPSRLSWLKRRSDTPSQLYYSLISGIPDRIRSE